MAEPAPITTTTPRQLSPRFVAWLVTFLLGLHIGLAVWAAAGQSVTSDEILHLAGGYFYNTRGDYRIQPENGNLPQRLGALPAALSGAPCPTLPGNIHWQMADAPMMGYQLFYETGHDHFPMLLAGRALITLFSAGTGWLVFWWARRLFGAGAALVALALYALDPNMLAHAALVTSDAAAVCGLLAAVTAFWLQLEKPTAGRMLGSALAFGLACVAKYSAVLLLPVFVLLATWRLVREPAAARGRWWRQAAVSAAIHVAGAVLVIWIFYGCRYSAVGADAGPAASFRVPWETLLAQLGWQGRVVDLARQWQLLPEAFLYGYGWVVWSAQTRSAFLAGAHSIHGWVSFFPLAFVWKTTLPLLAALPIGAVVLWRRWQAAGRRIADDLTAAAPLLVFTAVYWAFALTSHLNIGHRHLLPTYPLLFVLAGGLATSAHLSRHVRRLVGGALVLGQAVSCAAIFPHCLAHFNPLAGGPAHGYRLLVDSSLDWGQDLPSLKRWLDTHNTGPGKARVYLSYFGSGEPAYYHFAFTRLPCLNGFQPQITWTEIRGGLFCLSATQLQQVYNPVRPPWTPELEQEYQALRAYGPVFRDYFTNPARRPELLRFTTTAKIEQAWQRFDLLRLARLCSYLRAREPDATAGYSILIYRLDDATVARVLDGSYSEWERAVATAANPL